MNSLSKAGKRIEQLVDDAIVQVSDEAKSPSGPLVTDAGLLEVIEGPCPVRLNTMNKSM